MSPKNPAAVALGRKGGKARVKNQTPEQRKESASRAAQARWAKRLDRIDRSLARTQAQLADNASLTKRLKTKKKKAQQ